MKRTNCASVRECMRYPHIEGLSEHEILDLQELFLTYGYNHLAASSVGQARTLISLFVETLHSFSRIACLTASSLALSDNVVKLHDELAFHGALAFDYRQLDEFLLNSFYYDFLWIECSDDLIQAPWFAYFEKKLHDYNIAASMPILFVTIKDSAI